MSYARSVPPKSSLDAPHLPPPYQDQLSPRPTRTHQRRRLTLIILGVSIQLGYLLYTLPLILSSWRISYEVARASYIHAHPYTCSDLDLGSSYASRPNISAASGARDLIAEAKRRGCTFDALSGQWLPRQCSRRQTSEFVNAATVTLPPDSLLGRPAVYGLVAKWRYYNAERTKEIELAETPVYGGERSYVTTNSEQISRCIYSM